MEVGVQRHWVMGNWKMNGSLRSIEALLMDLQASLTEAEQARCVVFPPAIYLPVVQSLLAQSAMAFGAQNVYPAMNGAFTGEISGPMLQEYQCRYVLVGHSERRQLFGENLNFVAKKFHHAKEHDMIPVLCVGETLEERENGLTERVIADQLAAVMCDGLNGFHRAVIAYEPVWAIGTGKTASAEMVQDVHAYIRGFVASREPDSIKVPILYGGSVNEKNAQGLFSKPDVDGGLVGGASLNARQFVEIVKCIS
jgi:triosephosphate isomerase